MTGQINDTFLYNNKVYAVSAVENRHHFFDIRELGITPDVESSACWRGYIAKFSLYQNSLVLLDLDTNNANGEGAPVAINSIMPRVKKPNNLSPNHQKWRNWHYRNVKLPILYTGNILITDEFIRERYVHMGFQSPLSYHKVIELGFDRGKLISGTDLSDIVAQLREEQHMESREEQLARLPLWIEECFDLSYKSKWHFNL